MKRILTSCLILFMLFILPSCGAESGADEVSSSNAEQNTPSENETAQSQVDREQEPGKTASAQNEETNEGEVTIQIKITVDDTELYATFENNATTQTLIEQMPMTLSMSDLYGREMCYHYGAYALQTDELRTDGYEIGDIAYWPPGGSLVILYEQNGEQFERQHLGHIDSGVEIFEQTGDVNVTFEVISE